MKKLKFFSEPAFRYFFSKFRNITNINLEEIDKETIIYQNGEKVVAEVEKITYTMEIIRRKS